VTTRICIDAVKRPDGRDWYTDRGLLLRTRRGGPHGEILRNRVHNTICETRRVLVSRGIFWRFETLEGRHRPPCMAADIEKTAGLTVHEPDDNVVHFARWRPFDQNAACRSAFSGPAHVTMGTADTIAALPSDRRAMPAPANEVSNAWVFYWTLEIGAALIQVEQLIRLAVRMQAIQSGVDPISSSRAAAGIAERETAF
jgi:hypothetical protein